MILEKLLNQPASEPELFYGLTTAVRVAFHDLGRRAGYFIKIDRVGEGLSKFSYVMAFDCDEEYQDFKYSSEYNRCGVNVYNDGDHYHFIGFGFFYILRANVFVERVEFEKIYRYENPKFEYEKIRPPSRELIEAARREFGLYFSVAKRGRGAA